MHLRRQCFSQVSSAAIATVTKTTWEERAYLSLKLSGNARSVREVGAGIKAGACALGLEQRPWRVLTSLLPVACSASFPIPARATSPGVALPQ